MYVVAPVVPVKVIYWLHAEKRKKENKKKKPEKKKNPQKIGIHPKCTTTHMYNVTFTLGVFDSLIKALVDSFDARKYLC